MTNYFNWLVTTRWGKVLTPFKLAAVVSFLTFACPRNIAIPFAFLIAVTYVFWLCTNRFQLLKLSVILFLLASLSPVDLEIRDFKNTPEIREVRMGMPSITLSKMASENGKKYWYGGCFITLYDPRWMIVF